MVITVTEDYRLRFDESPLPGDMCTLIDGSPGIITARYKVEGKWYFFAAPEQLVDRSMYLKDFVCDLSKGRVWINWNATL